MNKNRTKTILIIIGAIIVIVACVILAEKYIGVSNNGGGVEVPLTITTSTAPTSTVSITVTPTAPTPVGTPGIYQNSSYSFVYPVSWSVSQMIPGSVNNFADRFGAGDALPSGGAEMIVATTSVYDGEWQSVVAGQLAYARNLTSSTVVVDGVTCAQEDFTATYGPGALAQNMFTYCPRGNELVKIYDAYPAGDPKGAGFMVTFRNILNSFKFL